MSTSVIWDKIVHLSSEENSMIEKSFNLPEEVVFFDAAKMKSSRNTSGIRRVIATLFIVGGLSMICLFILNRKYYQPETSTIIGFIGVLSLSLGISFYFGRKTRNNGLYREGVFFKEECLYIIKGFKYCKIDRSDVVEFDLQQISGNTSNPENGVYEITVKWSLDKEEYSCPIITINYESPVFEKLDLWKESGQLPN